MAAFGFFFQPSVTKVSKFYISNFCCMFYLTHLLKCFFCVHFVFFAIFLQSSRSSKKIHNFGKRSNSIKRNTNAPVIKRGWLYKQVQLNIHWILGRDPLMHCVKLIDMSYFVILMERQHFILNVFEV